MRRYYDEQPTSQLALWARRMALFSLAATFVSIIVVRSGLLELRPALATFAGALVLAVIALLLAFCAFVVIWREGLMGMGQALTAIALALALLAYPAYLAIKAYRLPRIYDITTDPIDPPRFEVLARIRPRNANPVIYAGLSAAELQRAAYPNIESIDKDANAPTAFKAALKVINRRKWRVVDQRPPTATRREGHIEAVVRTPIMGFREDVVVRVRPTTDGSRIDIRSSSRYGSFDFGSNAERVRTLSDDIDNAVGDEKPEETTPLPGPMPPSKKSKAPPKGGQSSAKK